MNDTLFVQRSTRHAPRLALALLLFTLYLITSSGSFHIIDEVSLYSVTENLARRGAWDTDQIAWSQWVNSPAEVLGTWGVDGHVYSKKGIAPALAFLPVRFLAGFIPGVGLLQTTFLANALITVATAFLLWAIAKRLGYSEWLGAVVALVFGIATLAWPYATHLFGEPLSALCLTAALWALIAHRQDGGWAASLVLGLALGVAVATSAVYILLLPVFGVAWLLARRDLTGLTDLSGLRRWAALFLPLILTALFLLWYNNLRFGSPFDTGYHFDSGEGFNGPFLAGLYGLLASPYRGILYHQPLTILSLLGFVPLFRRHRIEAILTGVTSLILVLAFATWWIWWGGFAWGPRFLVPLAPYLTLWLLPLLAGKRKWLVWGLIGLSALVQLLAVSANYVLWEIELRGLYPTDWENPLLYGAPATSNPLHSPVFGQISLLARGEWADILDFAWFQPNAVHWWVPILGLCIFLLAGWALFAGLKGRKKVVAPLSVLLLVLLIPFTWASLRAYAQSERYGSDGQGYAAILDQIDAGSQSGDTIVTITPYHYQIPMNRYDGPLPLLGFAQEQPLRLETERLLSERLVDHGSLFLLTSGLPPADPSNGVELWLNDQAYLAGDQWFDNFRLLRYGTMPPDRPLEPGQVWGDPPLFTLTDVRISTIEPVPGSVLTLDLTWLKHSPAPDLNLFVQLLPAAALPIAQFDRAYPAQAWVEGEPRTIPLGLWLPPDAPPGDHTLIVGWYNPATGERLPVLNQGDFAILSAIHIQPNPNTQ